MALDGTSHGKSMQGLELQPQNLTISSGCGAIINNLIYCITEPGEGVALPTPYYPAFDYDIKVRGISLCMGRQLLLMNKTQPWLVVNHLVGRLSA